MTYLLTKRRKPTAASQFIFLRTPSCLSIHVTLYIDVTMSRAYCSFQSEPAPAAACTVCCLLKDRTIERPIAVHRFILFQNTNCANRLLRERQHRIHVLKPSISTVLERELSALLAAVDDVIRDAYLHGQRRPAHIGYRDNGQPFEVVDPVL